MRKFCKDEVAKVHEGFSSKTNFRFVNDYFYPYKNVLIWFFCLDLLPELKAFSKLNENQCLL